jgi:hypothetical protein
MRDIGLEDTELEEVDPGTVAGASTSPQAAAEPEPFSFADLGLDEADFNDLRLEEPIDVEQETRNDLVPFGLADLEPSAPSVATSNGIAYGYARPDAGITQNGMAAPAAGTAQNEHSEIADLGLSDDELAHFGSNPETGGRTSEPFALADLGLSDMELASFNAAGEAIPVANEGSEELPSWLMDDDALLDQDTLDETSQIEGADRGSGLDPTGHDRATTAPDSWELDEPAASSVHEAETQPFEVASIVAEEGAGQAGPPSGDDVEPELPPMPTELSRYYERLEVDPNNHPIRLALARLSEQKNDTDRAIEQYRQLIRQGVLLDSVVEDLKEMVAGDYERPVLRRLHRLLGDAYTRQNRLDEALDEYSWT